MYITWMFQIPPSHGYEQCHINIICTHFISSKALLANIETPVPGKAPTLASRIPSSDCMNSYGHGDVPSRSPFRGGLVPVISSFGLAANSHVTQRHTGQPTTHGQRRRDVKATPFWQATCNPGLPMGLTEASSSLHQFNLPICPIPLPALSLHRCRFLINILHTKLYLSICFQRTQPVTRSHPGCH